MPTRLRIGGQSVRCQTRCESLPNCTQIGHSAESTKYVAGQQNTHVTWCKIEIDVRNKPAQRPTRARQHLGEARPRRWRLRHYQQSSATASRCSSRTCSTESNLPHDGTRKHPTRFRGVSGCLLHVGTPLGRARLTSTVFVEIRYRIPLSHKASHRPSAVSTSARGEKARSGQIGCLRLMNFRTPHTPAVLLGRAVLSLWYRCRPFLVGFA